MPDLSPADRDADAEREVPVVTVVKRGVTVRLFSGLLRGLEAGQRGAAGVPRCDGERQQDFVPVLRIRWDAEPGEGEVGKRHASGEYSGAWIHAS